MNGGQTDRWQHIEVWLSERVVSGTGMESTDSVAKVVESDGLSARCGVIAASKDSAR